MARKSGFVRRHGVMRRETVWFGGIVVTSTLGAASTAVFQTSLNAAALALRPFTVIRTRGHMLVRSDQTAANEQVNVMYGRAVVTDQAVAIGVTALPTPATDNDSDLWFQFGSASLHFGVDVKNSIQVLQLIDSKAMRRVEDGQDIAGVVETDANSEGAVIAVFTRSLVKLH